MYEAVTADDKLVTFAHIGEDQKCLTLSLSVEVACVQASDDELAHILRTFPNIPQPPTNQRVVRWFGDTAKFIAANVKWRS